MSLIFRNLRRIAVALLLVAGLALPVVAASSLTHATPAEAGVLKKAKKGTKLIGKGAGWVEKKLAKKGKVGKVVSKGFGGIRKGANATSKGIGKAQKGAKKAFGKVCRGKCASVAKGVKKVGKGFAKLKDQAEEKCARFGNNSKACKVAREALEFASPI